MIAVKTVILYTLGLALFAGAAAALHHAGASLFWRAHLAEALAVTVILAYIFRRK